MKTVVIILLFILVLFPSRVQAQIREDTSQLQRVSDWINSLTTSTLEKAYSDSLDVVGKENKIIFFPVSFDTKLPDNFPIDGPPLKMTTVEDVKIAQIAAQPLRDLLTNARAADYTVNLADGTRSFQEQVDVFESWIQKEQGGGLTRDEAYKVVETYSAKPGHSEHHLGTTVDLLELKNPGEEEELNNIHDAAQTRFDKGLYGWFREHAHEYGFVISYPTGSSVKDSKVGSGYKAAEPWHLRYVGKPLAMYLFKNNYLDRSNDLTLHKALQLVSSDLSFYTEY
jgi:LAS superfamily LD-carboxypeptidase LdcB